jgi:hypothetical protein
MARLLDALIRIDSATRVASRVLGRTSSAGRELQAAVRDIRAAVAAAALHELAERPDPKADLKQIFRACEAAGLSWPDLMDALNTYQESTPRLQ